MATSNEPASLVLRDSWASTDQGREMLTYFKGGVLVGSPVRMSDEQIISASRLIQRFHDATAGTALAGRQEIVAHNDLGPHNIVFAGESSRHH